MYIFLALFFIGFFLIPPKTYAQENTLKISPAFYDITVKNLQEEKKLTFTLENTTKTPISIELFTLDFRQENDLGTIGFLGRELGNYTYSLSSFLSFDNNNMEIAAGEKKKFEVTVINRQDLAPGGHYAAVIARQRHFVSDKPAVSLALSSLIYLTKVGGERYNLSFKDVYWPGAPVVFSVPPTSFISLQNDGNTHLTPYGTADIYDMFGRKIYKGIINESSVRVFPQSIRRIPVYFRKVNFVFPFSVNTLKISGRDGLNKTRFSYQEVFIYTNPYLLICIISVPFVILGYRKVVLKKTQKNKRNA